MNTDINETSEAQQATETLKAKQPERKGRTGKIIAAVLLSACLLTSLGLNIYQAVVPNQKTADFIDYILERIAEAESTENEYIEGRLQGGRRV